ncbi:MAG TPA: cytochrome P450 [Conexibacter sp.]|nr:cytochrome P450 [Conexibacter sp.]
MSAAAALPPGPSTPRLLQTLHFGSDPYRYFGAAHARYGDVFTMRPFDITWVVLAHPDPVNELFAHGPDLLDAGRATRGLRPFLGTRGVLMLDGDEHLARRRLELPAFHGEALRAYREVIAGVAARQLERLPLGEPVALAPRLRAIVVEVILRAIYGIEEPDRLRTFGLRLTRLLALAADPLHLAAYGLLGPGSLRCSPPLRARVRAVDEAVMAEIGRRRRDPRLDRRHDALSLLLRARDADGRGLSDAELRDELLTLMVAGNETAAAALAWAAHELARAPLVQRRIANGDAAYLKATVRETLRLHPPVHLGGLRVLRRALPIGGHTLPERTSVVVSTLVIHRRADLYPEPTAFRPERFLDRRPAAGAWVPFGGGVRRCLGAALAELELHVVIEQLVRRLRLRPQRAEREPPRRRGIVLVPRHDARVVATAR